MPVMCRRKPAGLSVATSQAHASLQACLQADGGKIGGIGKMPQPEAIEKQAGWGKSGGIGKIPQPEAIEKQAGLGKNGAMGKMPQPEA